MHVYDQRYPPAPTATLFPPDASIDEYHLVQSRLGIDRVVIVQPSTYGLDNRCQLAGMDDLRSPSRLVAVVAASITEPELEALTERGGCGARMHMLPGGALGWEAMLPVARRVADHGWHIQLQMNGNELAERGDLLRQIPVPVVVDHIGRFMPPPRPDSPAVRFLCDQLERGRWWVKLSAPYESASTDAEHHALDALVEHLVSRYPERLVWASNWPHPGQPVPPSPDDLADLVDQWLPRPTVRQQVLVDNPAELYGFDTN